MFRTIRANTKNLIKLGWICLPFIISCSVEQKSENIDVSEIKEPYDCMEALDLVTTDMLQLISNVRTKEEFNNDSNLVEKGEKITLKYNDIDDRCDELGFSKKDLRTCDKFQGVEEKMKIINKKMRL